MRGFACDGWKKPTYEKEKKKEKSKKKSCGGHGVLVPSPEKKAPPQQKKPDKIPNARITAAPHYTERAPRGGLKKHTRTATTARRIDGDNDGAAADGRRRASAPARGVRRGVEALEAVAVEELPCVGFRGCADVGISVAAAWQRGARRIPFSSRLPLSPHPPPNPSPSFLLLPLSPSLHPAYNLPKRAHAPRRHGSGV